MLELQDITKRFGDFTAVDSVSLCVREREMLGVIGRSGAGKSTLMRLINGLETPTSGSITYRGEQVSGLKGRHLREWRRRCAMVFQQFNLVDRLDVITNVLVGRLSYHGTVSSMLRLFSAGERAMAIHALDRMQLAAQALQRSELLSGGQKQRVAIARALVQEPRILLADEPTASLDPISAKRVLDAMKQINMDDGITLLCNLHHLHAARTYCTRIVGMAHGRVVFDGCPAELTSETIRQIYGEDAEGEEAVEPQPSRSLSVGT